jgi:hypothetical protein
MDGSSFDRLSRQFAARATRRRALGAVAGALIAGAAGAGAAEAARVCTTYGRACTRDGQCCSKSCQRDPRSRSRQRLSCACPVGESPCGTTCIDLAASTDNCGACGAACDPLLADACTDGTCTCGAGDSCGAGEKCYAGACIPLTCTMAAGSAICVVSTTGEIGQFSTAAEFFQSNSGEYGCDRDSECTLNDEGACSRAGVWCGCVFAFDLGSGLTAFIQYMATAESVTVTDGSGVCLAGL